MKDETKRKIRAKWERAKAKAPAWIFGGAIGAGVGGWVMSILNARDIERLGKCHNRLCDIVTNNATIQQKDQDRLNDVERQTNKLLEEALKRTEGEK